MSKEDMDYINGRLNELEDLLMHCRELEEDLLEYISRYQNVQVKEMPL